MLAVNPVRCAVQADEFAIAQMRYNFRVGTSTGEGQMVEPRRRNDRIERMKLAVLGLLFAGLFGFVGLRTYIDQREAPARAAAEARNLAEAQAKAEAELRAQAAARVANAL